MTTQEIKSKAFRVIDKVIILKANVFNGCYSDKAELAQEEARLEGIKNWAIANNQLQDIRNYFASKTFGNHLQFHAFEVSKFFNN